MKKQILITAVSMEIGGIERSLVGLLDTFDYDVYDVDLLLFSVKGEFLSLINPKCNILPEIPACASLIKPIKQLLFSSEYKLGIARLLSKLHNKNKNSLKDFDSDSLVFMHLQSIWNRSLKHMPSLEKKYDAALSFMWPHHFVAYKVHADKKLAWVHTDYSKAALDKNSDEIIWDCFDFIPCVSEACRQSFINIYPALTKKALVVENILSQKFVREQAEEFIPTIMSNDKSLKILTAGRFCHAKAFDVAADICKYLLDKNLDIKWYALGYGTLENDVRSKILQMNLTDKFIFLGKQLNPYPFIKACDIYVQPSRYEGKAVTVREAQMLGKPTVITNFATAASQVNDGVDAIISDMNVSAAAGEIEKLINNPEMAEYLSKNAFSSDYSNTQEINKIYDLI